MWLQGTIDFYNEATQTTTSGDYTAMQDFARLFMVPGTAHCGGEFDQDAAFDALVAWVENGTAPDMLLSKPTGSSPRTRLLCPHPTVAVYSGTGSADDPANFACGTNPVTDTEDANRRANTRIFGSDFSSSGF